MTPEELNDDASPRINQIGAVHYFHPITKAAGKDIELDLFRLYFLGRGGVLGDVDPEIVYSSFGYFDPALVAHMWTSARERVEPSRAAQVHLACAYRIGAEALTAVDGLDTFASAAAVAVDAVDPAGLTLFAGYARLPIPDAPAEAAMHQAIVLRELRGSIHLAAIAACGLRSRVAHAIRRPDDVEMFGWSDPFDVSGQHRTTLVDVDALTDATMSQAFAALSEDERSEFARVTGAIHAALGLSG